MPPCWPPWCPASSVWPMRRWSSKSSSKCISSSRPKGNRQANAQLPLPRHTRRWCRLRCGSWRGWRLLPAPRGCPCRTIRGRWGSGAPRSAMQPCRNLGPNTLRPLSSVCRTARRPPQLTRRVQYTMDSRSKCTCQVGCPLPLHMPVHTAATVRCRCLSQLRLLLTFSRKRSCCAASTNAAPFPYDPTPATPRVHTHYALSCPCSWPCPPRT